MSLTSLPPQPQGCGRILERPAGDTPGVPIHVHLVLRSICPRKREKADSNESAFLPNILFDDIIISWYYSNTTPTLFQDVPICSRNRQRRSSLFGPIKAPKISKLDNLCVLRLCNISVVSCVQGKIEKISKLDICPTWIFQDAGSDELRKIAIVILLPQEYENRCQLCTTTRASKHCDCEVSTCFLDFNVV